MKLVVFDIDGVLIDSRDAYSEAFHTVLKEQGIDVDVKEIRKRIVPSILLNLSFSIKDKTVLDVAVKRTEEIMSKKGIEKTILVPNTYEVLDDLRREARIIAVTNSNQGFIDAFVEKFKLEKYFEKIISAHTDYNADKAAAIKDNIENPNQTWYIGDHRKDVETARKVGCKVCIVYSKYSWDYPNLEGIKKMKPDKIVCNIGEIENAIK